ncbi:MAG: hypothetical protein AAB332_06285 [Planctomycetota bacterium]
MLRHTQDRSCGSFGALLPVTQLLEMFGRWDNFLSRGLADEAVEGFRGHERNGETTCLAW